MRTRFPYACVSAAISAVLFVIFGFKTSGSGAGELDLDGSKVKSLVLLVLPILMVILMKIGWDLMSTLITCDVLGIILNLALGTISLETMMAPEGPIIA